MLLSVLRVRLPGSPTSAQPVNQSTTDTPCLLFPNSQTLSKPWLGEDKCLSSPLPSPFTRFLLPIDSLDCVPLAVHPLPRCATSNKQRPTHATTELGASPASSGTQSQIGQNDKACLGPIIRGTSIYLHLQLHKLQLFALNYPTGPCLRQGRSFPSPSVLLFGTFRAIERFWNLASWTPGNSETRLLLSMIA